MQAAHMDFRRKPRHRTVFRPKMATPNFHLHVGSCGTSRFQPVTKTAPQVRVINRPGACARRLPGTRRSIARAKRIESRCDLETTLEIAHRAGLALSHFNFFTIPILHSAHSVNGHWKSASERSGRTNGSVGTMYFASCAETAVLSSSSSCGSCAATGGNVNFTP